MLTDNFTDGRQCYEQGDYETRKWFTRQWRKWPERVHPERTCNLRFHYGGITAHRAIFGEEPAMSADLASSIAFMDKPETPDADG